MARQKLIIEVRVNESMTHDRNPNLPYTPEEIAGQALECWRRGASIVHYHARDPETGVASADAKLYVEITRRIKRESDMILMPTLGASMKPTVEARLAHIVEMAEDPATKPDCIPVDMLTTNLDFYDAQLGAFNTDDRVYTNTTRMLMDLCTRARAIGVKPVSMMWGIAGVRLTKTFLELGLYSEPLYCELPLFGDGMPGYGHPATIRGMEALLDFFPPGARWPWVASVTGASAFPVIAGAIERGGHVAVGIPDCGYEELGYPTNPELVTRVVEMAATMGREVASAAEARAMLGIA